MTLQFTRKILYEQTPVLLRDCLLMPYNGDEESYLQSKVEHEMERLIFEYVKIMGEVDLVRELAEANGLDIVGYEDPDIGFVVEIRSLFNLATDL